MASRVIAYTFVVVTCSALLIGNAFAYVPEHVARQLLAPDHNPEARFTQQNVAYSDPDSSKHLMLDYQAQQHMHVQLWSLDAIVGLQDVELQHGKLGRVTVSHQFASYCLPLTTVSRLCCRRRRTSRVAHDDIRLFT